ncbi:MAG: hypothetical protein IKB27_01300 [Clostridia bacterium]|nr:hypothetical protein [Clostridia bacterium]
MRIENIEGGDEWILAKGEAFAYALPLQAEDGLPAKERTTFVAEPQRVARNNTQLSQRKKAR